MSSSHDTVLTERKDKVLVVTLNRPQARNAIDSATAQLLSEVFQSFEKDENLYVSVLTGVQGTFCAGADLNEIGEGRRPKIAEDGDGPMGSTWMALSKPVIAAVEGYAVAGGLELALWCDLRIAGSGAVFGVFNRRWGVPLIDLGTVRLPRMIGHSRALDMVLTGRAVRADEALQMGLVNRVVENGKALGAALEMANMIAAFPQDGLRGDRMSLYEQWSLTWEQACKNELRHGLRALASGEAVAGATRFASGAGRHGSFTR